MGFAVADDLQVEVVGGSAAGEHGVQLLPGFLPGGQAVHGIGGDALGGMDGCGVPEFGRLGDVGGGQPAGELVAGVPDGEVAVSADVGDGPPVAVLHPVGGAEAESAVVAAGDDHIADTGPVPVGQGHLTTAGVRSSRCARARALSSATSSRVGASMIASSPAARSEPRQ